VPKLVDANRAHAVGQKQFDELSVARLHGRVDGPVSVAVGQIGIGALPQQQGGRVNAALVARQVQQGSTLLVDVVDRHPVLPLDLEPLVKHV